MVCPFVVLGNKGQKNLPASGHQFTAPLRTDKSSGVT